MIVESWGFVCGPGAVYSIFGGYVGGVCLLCGSGGRALS